MLEQLIHSIVQRIGGDDLMNKAHAQGFRGIKALTGQKVTVPGARPHGAQHIGGDGGGHQSDLDLAQAEVGRVHSHSHIAGCHQPHATGIDIALHAGNGGQWAGVNGVQHVRELACIGQVFFAAVIRHAAHPVQIGSRTKAGPSAASTTARTSAT